MWRLGSRTRGKSVWLLANLLAKCHKAVCLKLWRGGGLASENLRTALSWKKDGSIGVSSDGNFTFHHSHIIIDGLASGRMLVEGC